MGFHKKWYTVKNGFETKHMSKKASFQAIAFKTRNSVKTTFASKLMFTLFTTQYIRFRNKFSVAILFS